ncbi:class D sortase [Cytobacillus massiliigabonensis]|uniref:class D sortase n=1 Tax=Cytobacillus massiliigabonensis TaxID=1871011 RepID=UPI000C8583E7|nr:class D sortase [Cytobacillus massiliigabonensis]
MRFVWSFVFISAGLLLLFYPQIEKEAADTKQEKLIQTFKQLGDVVETEEQADLTEIKEDQDQVELLDGARGILYIPDIDLEMLIFEGAGKVPLKKGTGMIEPDKEFGINNVGIAGHRSTTFGKQFNRLDELSRNDEIIVETKTGTYEYVIVQKFVVDRSKIEVLNDQKEPVLTLVTCTPIGQKNPTDRLIVQAKLKNKS